MHSSPDRLQAESGEAETLSPALPPEIERLAVCLLDCVGVAGLKLAVAESCTGGLLSSLLTDVVGTSHAFERGFVAYSKAAKHDMLAVPYALIDECGAVSEPVARAMAHGALAASQADLALAITGFAGPALPGEEEGLVHFACARRHAKARAQEMHYGPIGRSAIRIAALRTGLCLMLESLTGECPEIDRMAETALHG